MDSNSTGHDWKATARRLLDAGRNHEAVNLLQRVLAQGEPGAELHAWLGSALGMAGRHDESLEHLQLAAQMRSGHAAYRYNLGAAFERLGQIARAREEYHRALEIDPGYQRTAEALAMTGALPDQAAAEVTCEVPIQAPLASVPTQSDPAVESRTYLTGELAPPMTSAPVFPGANPTFIPTNALTSTPTSVPTAIQTPPRYLDPTPSRAPTKEERRLLYEEPPMLVDIMCKMYAIVAVLLVIAAGASFLAMISSLGHGVAGSVFATMGPDTLGSIAGAGLCFVMYRAMGFGRPSGWYGQVSVCILGILSGFGVIVVNFALLGPIVSGILLYYWWQPEIRQWFHVR